MGHRRRPACLAHGSRPRHGRDQARRRDRGRVRDPPAGGDAAVREARPAGTGRARPRAPARAPGHALPPAPALPRALRPGGAGRAGRRLVVDRGPSRRRRRDDAPPDAGFRRPARWRHVGRRPLGLPRGGMGRPVGMGPDRERGAHTLARLRRRPPRARSLEPSSDGERVPLRRGRHRSHPVGCDRVGARVRGGRRRRVDPVHGPCCRYRGHRLHGSPPPARPRPRSIAAHAAARYRRRRSRRRRFRRRHRYVRPGTGRRAPGPAGSGSALLLLTLRRTAAGARGTPRSRRRAAAAAPCGHGSCPRRRRPAGHRRRRICLRRFGHCRPHAGTASGRGGTGDVDPWGGSSRRGRPRRAGRRDRGRRFGDEAGHPRRPYRRPADERGGTAIHDWWRRPPRPPPHLGRSGRGRRRRSRATAGGSGVGRRRPRSGRRRPHLRRSASRPARARSRSLPSVGGVAGAAASSSSAGRGSGDS